MLSEWPVCKFLICNQYDLLEMGKNINVFGRKFTHSENSVQRRYKNILNGLC